VVIAQMAAALSPHDVAIDVVATTAHGQGELDVPLDRPVYRDHAQYFYFLRTHPKFWMFSWSLRQWLYRHVPDYDLVHVHGLFAYTTLPACAAARHFKKPYVITTHGVLDPWCLSHKWWKKYPYYYLLERDNLKHVSALHVTSPFEATGLARLGFSEKSHVIPLCVDLPDYVIKYQPGKESLNLLFLSRLDPIKGLPVLLEAIKIIRAQYDVPVQLKIAGQGDKEYVFQLQKFIKKLNISANVVFVGFLQGAAKSDALAEADIFVLPSYHENFGLAAAEALAAGLPVVLSDQVGIAHDVTKAGAGTVVPVNRPLLLAEAIMKYRNLEARVIAGANARILAEKCYSKKHFGDALFRLYEAVLAQHSKLRYKNMEVL
jgi:glycosyltransferase involved in cell wall biosynthesis